MLPALFSRFSSFKAIGPLSSRDCSFKYDVSIPILLSLSHSLSLTHRLILSPFLSLYLFLSFSLSTHHICLILPPPLLFIPSLFSFYFLASFCLALIFFTPSLPHTVNTVLSLVSSFYSLTVLSLFSPSYFVSFHLHVWRGLVFISRHISSRI